MTQMNLDLALPSQAATVALIRAATLAAPPDLSSWEAVERSAARDLGALLDAVIEQWWRDTLGPPRQMGRGWVGSWVRVDAALVVEACRARGRAPQHLQVFDDGEHVVAYATTRVVSSAYDLGDQIWVAREIDRAAWLRANERLRAGAQLAIGAVHQLRLLAARPWHERRVEDYCAWADGLAPLLEGAEVMLRQVDTVGTLEFATADPRYDHPAPLYRVTSIGRLVVGAPTDLGRARMPHALPWLPVATEAIRAEGWVALLGLLLLEAPR